MKPVGTIFATPAQLAAADAFADRVAEGHDREARNNPILAACERRVVGTEVRYYQSPAKYATVCPRNGRVRWFEVRGDGDYAIKNP